MEREDGIREGLTERKRKLRSRMQSAGVKRGEVAEAADRNSEGGVSAARRDPEVAQVDINSMVGESNMRKIVSGTVREIGAEVARRAVLSDGFYRVSEAGKPSRAMMTQKIWRVGGWRR
jgi:hypothetical protein